MKPDNPLTRMCISHAKKVPFVFIRQVHYVVGRQKTAFIYR